MSVDLAAIKAQRADRREAQVRRMRKHRRVAWLIGAALLLAAGTGVYVVRFTSVLGLSEVSVVDAATGKPVGADMAAELAAVLPPADGRPLVTVDTEQLWSDISALPAVAAAEVNRNWPDTVQVRITERVGVATVSANGELWLLDADGFPFRSVDATPDGLLQLRLATPGVDDPATMAGLAVARGLPDHLSMAVATVSARTAYDITFELTDGRVVVWGDSTQAARKAQALTAVLTQPGTRFDVSDPDLVTVLGGTEETDR